MADVSNDVEQLNAALAAMAEKAAADPEYRESLKANQVEALQVAGVSAFALAGVFAELGAEEEEVAAFGMSMPGGIGAAAPGGGGDPSELIFNTNCIGTCRRSTIVITLGCKNSFH